MGSKVNRENGSNFFLQFSSNLDLKSFSPAIASYLKRFEALRKVTVDLDGKVEKSYLQKYIYIFFWKWFLGFRLDLRIFLKCTNVKIQFDFE